MEFWSRKFRWLMDIFIMRRLNNWNFQKWPLGTGEQTVIDIKLEWIFGLRLFGNNFAAIKIQNKICSWKTMTSKTECIFARLQVVLVLVFWLNGLWLIILDFESINIIFIALSLSPSLCSHGFILSIRIFVNFTKNIETIVFVCIWVIRIQSYTNINIHTQYTETIHSMIYGCFKVFNIEIFMVTETLHSRLSNNLRCIKQWRIVAISLNYYYYIHISDLLALGIWSAVYTIR